MTKPKTSIQKLEARNETVKDLRSALIATRWKWREINRRAVELWHLIDHICGFCMLALKERGAQTAMRSKWGLCPEEVNKFCHELQGKNSEIMAALDTEILNVTEFLNVLKYKEMKSDVN